MNAQHQATMAERIAAKLQSALAPISLEVIDESRKHAGHAHVVASGNTGETHFHIKVVSDAFAGKSRIDRHRTINELLGTEFAASMHALSIEAKAPGE